MILYHGTSIKNADKIMDEGFKDRVDAGIDNWTHTISSHKGFVYLTLVYPFYFAQAAAQEGDKKASIIQVEVNDEDIYPDEDFLLQAMKSSGANVDVKDIREFKHCGMLSLENLGNCAVKFDKIKPLKRKDFKIIDMFAYSDPCISLENFMIMSEYYKELVRRWWNGEDYTTMNQMEFINKSLLAHNERMNKNENNS